ncbi:MAG: TusE/DsrC/DsvC family sulfur relay protein [Desulfobacterales bacterium]|jgi:tRNA 2-thiouridine synthesizing protein E
MKTVTFKNKAYEVDKQNFLLDSDAWDENFAVGMAHELDMPDGLTERHWEVIRFIRNRFKETGACPVVHETARVLGLDTHAFQELFPTGYLRGACLLAGISFRYGWVYYFGEPYSVSQKNKPEKPEEATKNKVYRTDLFGSLVDPSEWDEDWAARRAYEMGIKNGLTEKHLEIINYLRERYEQNHKIPTIYECCASNDIQIDEFADFFPSGYHRGAIKIAGLPTFGLNDS